MKTLFGCLVASLVCMLARSALAQGSGSASAYVALVSTPTAGVPPLAKQWMLAEPAPGFGVETQWGHVSGNGGSINTFVSGITLPLAPGRADIGFSAGTLRLSCDGGSCGEYFVASSVVEGRVLKAQIGGALLSLGLSGRIGYGKPSDGTLWSAATNVPLSLAMSAAGDFQLVTFVSPGFGWGRVGQASDSQTGTRFMLGGGIGAISSKSGVGFTLGLQKVFINRGKMVLGAALSWSKR